jgi:hypothetical protein
LVGNTRTAEGAFLRRASDWIYIRLADSQRSPVSVMFEKASWLPLVDAFRIFCVRPGRGGRNVFAQIQQFASFTGLAARRPPVRLLECLSIVSIRVQVGLLCRFQKN